MMIKLGRLTIASLLVLSGLTLFGVNAPSAGEETFTFEVIGLNRSAWVTRKDNSVKSSLKVGDVLYRGDRVEVMSAHDLQLSMNEERTNVIHVVGPSVMTVAKSRRPSIKLDRGTIFSLLDDLAEGQGFKIKTPLAVAAVRGTHYQVTHKSVSEVMTYEGRVSMAGWDPSSNRETSQPVMIEANMRSVITPRSPVPLKPFDISSSQLQEIDKVRNLIDDARRANSGSSRFSQQSESSGQFTQDSLGSPKEIFEDDEKKSSGQLVY